MMVKKAAKTKSVKAKKKKTASNKADVASLTPSAIKNKLGGKNWDTQSQPQTTAAGAEAVSTSSSLHAKGSAIISPGLNGTTIICFFNENTGNYDNCQTVNGKVGLVSR